ncbi:MAG: hypothetical protein ABSB61_11740 [Anaerolineales bacterium]|jgi:hypothetical protein
MMSFELTWLKTQLYLLMAVEQVLMGLYSARRYLRPAGIALAAGFALGLLVAWL